MSPMKCLATKRRPLGRAKQCCTPLHLEDALLALEVLCTEARLSAEARPAGAAPASTAATPPPKRGGRDGHRNRGDRSLRSARGDGANSPRGALQKSSWRRGNTTSTPIRCAATLRRARCGGSARATQGRSRARASSRSAETHAHKQRPTCVCPCFDAATASAMSSSGYVAAMVMASRPPSTNALRASRYSVCTWFNWQASCLRCVAKESVCKCRGDRHTHVG